MSIHLHRPRFHHPNVLAKSTNYQSPHYVMSPSSSCLTYFRSNIPLCILNSENFGSQHLKLSRCLINRRTLLIAIRNGRHLHIKHPDSNQVYDKKVKYLYLIKYNATKTYPVLNKAAHHENVWRSGSIVPHILNIGAILR